MSMYERATSCQFSFLLCCSSSCTSRNSSRSIAETEISSMRCVLDSDILATAVQRIQSNISSSYCCRPTDTRRNVQYVAASIQSHHRRPNNILCSQTALFRKLTQSGSVRFNTIRQGIKRIIVDANLQTNVQPSSGIWYCVQTKQSKFTLIVIEMTSSLIMIITLRINIADATTFIVRQ